MESPEKQALTDKRTSFLKIHVRIINTEYQNETNLQNKHRDKEKEKHPLFNIKGRYSGNINGCAPIKLEPLT